MYETYKTAKYILSDKKLIRMLDNEYMVLTSLKGSMSINKFAEITKIDKHTLKNFFNYRSNFLSKTSHKKIYKKYGICIDYLTGLSEHPLVQINTLCKTGVEKIRYIRIRTGTSERVINELTNRVELYDTNGDITMSAAFILAANLNVSMDWIVDTADMQK